MNTCKTCRFYKEDKRYANVAECMCPKIIFGVGDEDDDYRFMVSKKDDHLLIGDECAVVDGSEYAGALMPCPDFGCIHHEERV